ncbi:MAG TPA: hypothetical protein VGM39_01910 [Kofleriaceae bacterium]
MRYLAICAVCAACGPGVRPIADQRCIDGTAVTPTLPPTPRHPEVSVPQVVEPTLLEGHRIVGNKNVVPDRDTMRFIHDHGVGPVVTSVRICLDPSGVPEQIAPLSPSCFPRYEDAIVAAMHDWRYSPYQVNGVAVPVCTAVSFLYRQH